MDISCSYRETRWTALHLIKGDNYFFYKQQDDEDDALHPSFISDRLRRELQRQKHIWKVCINSSFSSPPKDRQKPSALQFYAYILAEKTAIMRSKDFVQHRDDPAEMNSGKN